MKTIEEGGAIKPASEIAPYEVVDFANILAVACPCGEARRAFSRAVDLPATLHVTTISVDAKKHYHKNHTEIYYFLECQSDALMELNENVIPVAAGQAILIRPETRHRALGRMKVLIICFPKFDPQDEWLD